MEKNECYEVTRKIELLLHILYSSEDLDDEINRDNREISNSGRLRGK